MLPAARNLSLCPLQARRSPFALGEKLWVNGWIRAVSCVCSGGSSVDKYRWLPSDRLKVQVKGDIYAHSPVEESISEHPTLRDQPTFSTFTTSPKSPDSTTVIFQPLVVTVSPAFKALSVYHSRSRVRAGTINCIGERL